MSTKTPSVPTLFADSHRRAVDAAVAQSRLVEKAFSTLLDLGRDSLAVQVDLVDHAVRAAQPAAPAAN